MTHTIDGLTFDGELLGSITSHDPEDGTKAHYWSSLDVYRTAEGRFIVHKISAHGDQPRRSTVKVYPSRKKAQDFIGYGAMAIHLYQDLGWPL